jgi:ATP-binding cassette subfamily B multidrug efflux pump
MLIKLLRSYLRPYSKALLAVVALQLVATMASLYLPSLNADIIDKGVAKGDTGYILNTGARSPRFISARVRRWRLDVTSGQPSSTGWALSPRARSPSSARLR